MKKRTYAEIQADLARLKAESEEVAGVIAKIKEAIKHYGLTPADLFGDEPKKASKVAKKPAKKAKRTSTAYSDGVNTWSGFGPKPAWLKDALEAGKTLEELKV